MPTPTAEMNDWIHQLYGKHPDDFQPPEMQRPAAPASDMPGAPPVGPSATPPGHSPTPPAPPTPAQWSASNKAAMDKMGDAASRVVMQAPALTAQGRVQIALQAISAALSVGNTAAATTALAGAQADCQLVMSQTDAAMGQVHKGQHPDQVLFGKETTNANHPGPADTQDIQPSDINQDGVGDCWLLSTLGEVARIKPDMIRKMIKDNNDGTYTVTLFKHKGGVSGFFAGLFGGNDLEPVKVTVDADFGSNTVNSQPQQAQVGNQHEIWVQVVEKAFAKLNGGYDKITHGGWPMDAMEAVTGKKAEKKPIGKLTVDELANDLAKGKPVVMDTMAQSNPNILLPFGMYGPHAYMVDKIVGQGPNAIVILKNPWGNRHPLPIPFSQLGLSVSVVDTGGAL